MKFRPELPLLLLAVLAAASVGCQSSSGSGSAAKTPKPKRVYEAPVYQTGSLIPVNRGGSGTSAKRYSATNGTPAMLDTQRMNSGAPAGVRGN